MISLNIEGTKIALEETALKDLIMGGLPGWIQSHAEGDAKSRLLYQGFKGVAIMMRVMIRRDAAKKGVELPYDEEEDPVIGLSQLMLEGAMQFISNQQAEAIYEELPNGEGVIIKGLKIHDEEWIIPSKQEALPE